MKLHRILSALQRDGWLIDQGTADALMPLVFRLMNGEEVAGGRQAGKKKREEEAAAGPLYAVQMAASASGQPFQMSRWSRLQDAPKGSVAVIRIEDVLMKADDCGMPGTASMARMVQQAAAADNIAGILLQIDSPGGQVQGTATLADAIREARQQKPVLSLVDDGMMCSAALWAGVAADEVYASRATDVIGSIGVYTTFVDARGRYEQMGYKLRDVYAPQSTEKNADYKAALAGNDGPLKDRLAHIAQQFIDSVKADRGDRLNAKAGDPFKGATYNAIEAQKVGLLDGVLSFRAAVQRVSTLAAARGAGGSGAAGGASASTKPNSQDPMKRPLLSALLAGAALAANAAGNTELSEAQLDNIEAALTDRDTQKAAADKGATDLKAATDAATAKETELNGKITTLEAKVAELGKRPAGDAATVRAEADPATGTEAKEWVDPKLAALKNHPVLGWK